MNETLKFSWGHIIAFLALIAVSYISFMGFTYLTNGDFTVALIGMGITDLVYIIVFIGAQQLKASGVKMKKKIVWERILIFGSPLVFVVGMISMSHFWTVKSQNDAIVEIFTNAINSSTQLFSDYEEYSNQRIDSYQNNLTQIIVNKNSSPQTYRKAGFEDSKASIQRDNMVETLRLQLLSQNYDSLKTVAYKWIEEAARGASTWNVFLLGNTREIKEALGNWENQLKSFSEKEMSNEPIAVGTVDHFQSNGAKNAIAGIDNLTSSFTTQKFPTLAAIIFGLITYFMLLFPYIIQDRHTKNVYRLIGSESDSKHKNVKSSKPRKPISSEDSYDDSIEEAESLNFEEDNDYPSF